MDYSKTINLPETEFPMKANLPEREPAIQQRWESIKLYETIQTARQGAEQYILHDGPPYANGHIHIGHALNKILKDFIVKHKTMSGFQAPYIPGWDCHGLPIELNVTKKLGDKAATMDKVSIRKGCRDYAEEFIAIQMDEFKRLGVLGEYSNPYKTLSKDYEAKIVSVFGELVEKGYVYRSKKPIYWCPSCVTALAEAEVEYDDHTSTSIYFRFPVTVMEEPIDGINIDKLSVGVWTTTPWTLPANLALCFHPDFDYSAFAFGDEHIILANGLVEQFEQAAGLTCTGTIPLSKNQIKQLTVAHPFIDRQSAVIFGDHVTLEQGTGIVHTAPGHGMDDYRVGLEYGLEAFCPVDDNGLYTDDYPDMKGVHIFKANAMIVNMLEEKGILIKKSDIQHSYPHCWRCKKPLVFRATEQWFFSIDHDGLRNRAAQVVDDTAWIPSWGESRFRSMVEGRPDWCLSRQRSWGVPIPSFTCNDCGTNLMTGHTVHHFAKISLERGIDSWFSDDIKELIPENTVCSCGGKEFTKDYDILDVWFDSGVSHFAVLEERPYLRWPANMYLEGSDQHRGWFQSSLWPALALKGRAPYNEVLTHGFVLDEKGKAMSKSQGNVVPPEKIIKQYGADILRLWVSSEDYRNDLRIGMDMMKQISDSYRKIRNSFKFILGNLSDFDEKEKSSYEALTDLDKWVLHKLYELSEKVIDHYEKYEFHQVYRRILNFCAVELSSIYFDVTKDTLYVEKINAPLRRGVQTVLNEVYNTLVRLIAPILAFTADEIWEFKGNQESVHLENYYALNPAYNNAAIAQKVDKLVNLKEDLLKSLEGLRKDKIIRASLEADVVMFIGDPAAKALVEELGDKAARFFQVARIQLVSEKNTDMTDFQAASIAAVKTEWKKCIRCWNYFENLGSHPDHPEICDRCAEALK